MCTDLSNCTFYTSDDSENSFFYIQLSGSNEKGKFLIKPKKGLLKEIPIVKTLSDEKLIKTNSTQDEDYHFELDSNELIIKKWGDWDTLSKVKKELLSEAFSETGWENLFNLCGAAEDLRRYLKATAVSTKNTVLNQYTSGRKDAHIVWDEAEFSRHRLRTLLACAVFSPQSITNRKKCGFNPSTVWPLLFLTYSLGATEMTMMCVYYIIYQRTHSEGDLRDFPKEKEFFSCLPRDYQNYLKIYFDSKNSISEIKRNLHPACIATDVAPRKCVTPRAGSVSRAVMRETFNVNENGYNQDETVIKTVSSRKAVTPTAATYKARRSVSSHELAVPPKKNCVAKPKTIENRVDIYDDEYVKVGAVCKASRLPSRKGVSPCDARRQTRKSFCYKKARNVKPDAQTEVPACLVYIMLLDNTLVLSIGQIVTHLETELNYNSHLRTSDPHTLLKKTTELIKAIDPWPISSLNRIAKLDRYQVEQNKESLMQASCLLTNVYEALQARLDKLALQLDDRQNKGKNIIESEKMYSDIHLKVIEEFDRMHLIACSLLSLLHASLLYLASQLGSNEECTIAQPDSVLQLLIENTLNILKLEEKKVSQDLYCPLEISFDSQYSGRNHLCEDDLADVRKNGTTASKAYPNKTSLMPCSTKNRELRHSSSYAFVHGSTTSFYSSNNKSNLTMELLNCETPKCDTHLCLTGEIHTTTDDAQLPWGGSFTETANF